MELSAENIKELIAKIIEHLSVEGSIEVAIEAVIEGLNIESDGVEFFKQFAEDSIELCVEGIYESTSEKLNDMEIVAILKSNEQLKNIVTEIIKSFARRNIIVEILVEEPSMENLLNIVLPQILPTGYELGRNCFVRPHQGKSDLQRSIPKKVTAYRHFPQAVRLIVIQDQDSNDCVILKQNLIDLIRTQNLHQPYLVRIACKELENWYLGDMQAIESIYPTFKATTHQKKAKYRHTDNIFGADDLERQIKDFSKGYASKNIPKNMILNKNTSPSFNHLLSGIEKFLN
jgi:hypothetical protein